MTARRRNTASAVTAAPDPDRVRALLAELTRIWPLAECGLVYRSPFELLVATILSAQCTDVQVNRVTPALFAVYPDPRSMAAADPERLEELIRPTGFFRNKAHSLLACSRVLMEKHGGAVPRTLEQMVTLPGVGRKTANVVLGEVFAVPGIVVDTHVKRLSQRLGLTTANDPEKIERDLMGIIPQPLWTVLSHLLITHGRHVCFARAPLCDACALRRLCPYGSGEGERIS
ncbi:MAG: endonuclease III [Deltaproteobacteria bacterium]|nr:endonuclease III [Candidatus Anaeroferrophillacea bacterium]